MKTRIITGAGYVAVMVAFFLLRQFVSIKIFHLLTAFLIVAGSFEAARLVKDCTVSAVKWLAVGHAVLFVLAYLVVEYIYPEWGWIVAFDLTMVTIFCWSVFALIKKMNANDFLYTLLPFVYPTLPLLSMLLANDAVHGFIILLLSFVISPVSDTAAYFVGSAIGGKKLCPKISPKKTWSGAIGGVVGGAIGALIVYLIFKPRVNFFSPILFFIGIGIIASIVNIFGDLFESLLKRKVGVKDSGKLLPGHGGVLDRIDGTIFVVVFLYLTFLLV